MDSPRVFVSSEPPSSKSDRDFSSATHFGQPIFILPSSPSPSASPGPALFQVAKKLRDFNPDRDSVVFGGGDPAALLLIGAVLAGMNIEKIQYLRWERERGMDGNRTGSGFYLPSRMPLRLT